MNRFKILKYSILPLVSLLTLVSCNKQSGNEENVISVWTSYSTQKVVKQTYRNDSFINNGEKLKIQMMKDEYESSQIIITSKQKKYFDIEINELVDKETGNKIPVDSCCDGYPCF